MLRVYTCIVQEHDLRLVVLAAVVCALASFTAINLIHHVRRSAGQMRQIWLGVAATATGFGIWATHFIAMLAFSPAIPSGYNVALTLLSLVAAIMLTGIGLGWRCRGRCTAQSWLGGAIVGGGIATMHYTGMAAFEIQGRSSGSRPGHRLDRRRRADRRRGHGVGLIEGESRSGSITVRCCSPSAICSHHFTAMAAASIIPDPRIVVSETAIPTGWLAVAVAFASLAILLLACCGLALDIRDRRRLEQETDRMRGLANAAVEGLLVCDGETIDDRQPQLRKPRGHRRGTGRRGASVVLPARRGSCERRAARTFGRGDRDRPAPGRRRMIPVELVSRPVSFANQPRLAIAVRDIRARKKAEADLRHSPSTMR